MIKYILECKNKHKFESWFSTSKEFEKLQKNNLLECIHCESKAISKSIMSPNILNTKEKKIKNENDNLKKIKKDLKNLRKFVENNFEFVGNKFANRNLPAVDVYFSNFLLPFSSTVSYLEIIVLCTFISPDDKANSI